MPELNKDVCKRYLKVLEQANEHWFYDYNWEIGDQAALSEALAFFSNIQQVQREKLIKEGKL